MKHRKNPGDTYPKSKSAISPKFAMGMVYGIAGIAAARILWSLFEGDEKPVLPAPLPPPTPKPEAAPKATPEPTSEIEGPSTDGMRPTFNMTQIVEAEAPTNEISVGSPVSIFGDILPQSHPGIYFPYQTGVADIQKSRKSLLYTLEPPLKTLKDTKYLWAKKFGTERETTAFKNLIKTKEYLENRKPLTKTVLEDPKIRPDYDRRLSFLDNGHHYVEMAIAAQRETMVRLARISGIEITISDLSNTDEARIKAIPVFTEKADFANDKYKKFDANVKAKGIIYTIAALLACEGNSASSSYSLLDRQKEYVSIMWALVNRFTTGYASRQLAPFYGSCYAWPRAVYLAGNYDPISKIEGNVGFRQDLAISLMPLVKAFLFGFFGDVSQGTTHWTHLIGNNPLPLYYYPSNTKKRDGSDYKEGVLCYDESCPTFYVNNCAFVKVID